MRVDVYIKYNTVQSSTEMAAARAALTFLLLLVFLSLAGFLPLFTPSSSFFPQLHVASSSRFILPCRLGLRRGFMSADQCLSLARDECVLPHWAPGSACGWDLGGLGGPRRDGRKIGISISLSGFSLEGEYVVSSARVLERKVARPAGITWSPEAYTFLFLLLLFFLPPFPRQISP